MSLEVSGNKIIIHNSSGIEKFNSSQRLLYQTGYAAGTNLGVGASTKFTAMPHGLTIDNSKDIVTAYITLTTASGSIADSLLNVRQPAQGMIPIDFYARNVSNTPAVDSSWITVYVTPDHIILSGSYESYSQQQQADNKFSPNIQNGTQMDWEIFVYRYTS
jgi:hypothetical protein